MFLNHNVVHTFWFSVSGTRPGDLHIEMHILKPHNCSSPLPSTKTIDTCCGACFLMWVLGVKLRLPCLYNKHFPDMTVSSPSHFVVHSLIIPW